MTAKSNSNKGVAGFEKGLPANLDAEKFVLGSILLDGKRYKSACELLDHDDFSLESHKRIFLRMGDVASRGMQIDRVTLANELINTNQLESIGGLSYLVSLDEGLPRIDNLHGYLSIVKVKSLERKTIFLLARAGKRLMMGRSGDIRDELAALRTDATTLLDEAKTEEKTIFSPQETADEFGGPADFLQPWRVSPGLPTGFAKLDETIYGLQPGVVHVICADTTVGKSALAINMGYNIASAGNAVGIFTLEMTRQVLLHRMICGRARVPYTRFRLGRMGTEERERILQAYAFVMELPLYFDETPSIDVHTLCERAERMVVKNKVKFVIVDYIQIMNRYNSGDGHKYRDENEQLTDTSQRFASTSKRLKIPWLYLSQLSRAKRMRVKSDMRPKLSDLHGSSSLEKDARVIMAIYREEMDAPARSELKGKAELIVLKNSNGDRKTIKMEFEKLWTVFKEAEDETPKEDERE